MFTDPDVARSLDTIVDQNATIIQLLEQLVAGQGSFEPPSSRVPIGPMGVRGPDAVTPYQNEE